MKNFNLNKLNIKDDEEINKDLIITEINSKFNSYGEDDSEIVKMEKENHFIEYLVKVVSRRLQCFSGPGINYSPTNVATKGDIFTIIEEANGLDAILWGRINSEENSWVPLDYCENI